MAHGRVAIYAVTGSSDEVIRRVRERVAPAMQQQPGFGTYQGVVSSETIVSYSTWETAEQAEAASQLLRGLLQETLSDLITLDHLYYGEVVDLTNA
jgi:hypothetical protein